MTVTCTAWRALEKNTLCGFATLVIEPPGLEISDVALHEREGKRWVSLPARPMTDRDGAPLRGDNGKSRYQPFLRWRTREINDRFQAAAIEAIEQFRGAP